MHYMIDPPSDEVLSPSPHVMDCELRSWAAHFYKKMLFSFDYPALMIHQRVSRFEMDTTMKSVDTAFLKNKLTFSGKDSSGSFWFLFGTSSLLAIILSVTTLKEVNDLV